MRVPGRPSIHPVHRPTARLPSYNTLPDSCGVYTGCLRYWMDYVKTIESMLDKINESTRMSLNTYCASRPPSYNTPPDSCGVYTRCLRYWTDYVKTIESMLDKINKSTRMSFNTSCASTHGVAAELQHPAGFLWSIHQMSDISDGLC